MEHAAFKSPLSDEQLKELGRLVINCGFVEFLIGFHVSMLLEVKGHPARIALINPLSTHRKIDILTRGLRSIPKPETRALVDEACKLISPTIRERNVLLHGIWGVDGKEDESQPVVVSTKDVTGHLRAENITKNADALAIGSRKLVNAMEVDSGRKVSDEPQGLHIELA